jgi:hypothetical protein
LNGKKHTKGSHDLSVRKQQFTSPGGDVSMQIKCLENSQMGLLHQNFLLKDRKESTFSKALKHQMLMM